MVSDTIRQQRATAATNNLFHWVPWHDGQAVLAAASASSRALEVRYQSDTIAVMAMTLRLTDEEQDKLKERAANDGLSMQEVARQAIREYVGLADHRDRVVASAERIMRVHAEAIEQLGR